MPAEFTTWLGRSLPTYTWLLILVVCLSLGVMLWRVPQGQRAPLTDVFLAGLLGAVVGGRVEHVLLQWAYFTDNRGEIAYLNGLDWHGAFLGAFFVVMIVARWRKRELIPLLDRAALLLPLVALAAWWGCAASGCAYGAPVENLFAFPRWLTWEGRDIFGIIEPRFAVQRIGALWALLLCVCALFLTWRGWLAGRRLWLIICLLSVAAFLLGFLRADYTVTVNGLRVDQYLDAILACYGGVFLLRSNHNPHFAPSLQS